MTTKNVFVLMMEVTANATPNFKYTKPVIVAEDRSDAVDALRKMKDYLVPMMGFDLDRRFDKNTLTSEYSDLSLDLIEEGSLDYVKLFSINGAGQLADVRYSGTLIFEEVPMMRQPVLE